ncbi:MAG: hypothetical protein ACRDBY_13960 [Cetobacterium sp.]
MKKLFILDVQKEIVSKIKSLNLNVTENPSLAKLPCVMIGEGYEVSNRIKTHNSNIVNIVIDIWGKKQGNSIEVKRIANDIVNILNSDYVDSKIDMIKINSVNYIKELEKEKDTNTFTYHCNMDLDVFVIE